MKKKNDMDRPSIEELQFLQALNSSYRLLLNYGARCIKEREITITQAYMLVFLGLHPGMTLEDISKELLLAKSAIHLTLRQLVAGGYLERVPVPHDKRMYHFKLLDKATALLPVFYGLMRDINTRALSVLSDDERKTFLSLLGRVNQKIKTEYKDS